MEMVGHDGVRSSHDAEITLSTAQAHSDGAGRPADPVAAALYDKLRDTCADGITADEIPQLIASAMVLVEHFRNVPGPQKRRLVLTAVGRLASEFLPAESQGAVQNLMHSFAPSMIDTIASAAKGQLGINQILQAAAATGSCLVRCCAGDGKRGGKK